MHIARTSVKWASLGILSLMLLLLANNALFMHTHTTADGRVVTHAHPLNSTNNDSSEGEQHQHSGGQMLLLDQITHLKVILYSFSFSVLNIEDACHKKSFYVYEYTLKDLEDYAQFERPPPCMI